MGRRAVVILALLAASLVVGGAAAAQKPQPLNLPGGIGFTQFDSVLERYNVYPLDPDPANLVRNPFAACTWDINDHLDRSVVPGYLDPGGSSSVDQCMVAPINPIYHSNFRGDPPLWWSGASNWYGAAVYSTSAKLSAAVCYQPQGRCFQLSLKGSGQSFEYDVCVAAIYAGNDASVPVVPGSTPPIAVQDGASPGYGVVSTLTLTVTNLSGHQVKGIGAQWGVSSDQSYPAGCAANPNNGTLPLVYDYPFRVVVQ